MGGAAAGANRLAREKSPYLLQHANNPVDWYAWGDEAFAAAKKTGRPIFLSVGYSTCHWCHVMEHESFENPEVAAVLNQHFIAIKVDREERPDIDALYMAYTQAATGRGGWPMSVWLTPDRKPFYAGTYFPPFDFTQILTRLSETWTHERAKIDEAADEAAKMLAGRDLSGGDPQTVKATPQRFGDLPRPPAAPGVDMRAACDAGFKYLEKTFDHENGGFGGAPKFPRPVSLAFLLRYDHGFKAAGAREMVLATLRHMAAGGIHDQLGGGFHRYAVDDHWHVPHFEKMLYDQAQLVAAYLEGWQLTREPLFERTLRDTCDYVLRDLAAPGGGFFSAEDADSAEDAAHPKEKREGAFYVWTTEELHALLGAADADLFAAAYGAEPAGNAEHDPQGELAGRNVLFAAQPVAELAKAFKDDEAGVTRRLASCRAVLLAARAKRPRPHLDDKVLAAWNGLMLGALARAGAALHEPRYLEAARRSASFIFGHMLDRQHGWLLRRWREGDAAIGGFLDDYTFVVFGLLDLYEATGEWKWLSGALKLQEIQDQRFADPAGGYFSTTGEDASLLARTKDDYDGAEPAGNSIAAMNLLRLGRLTGREDFAQAADHQLAWSVTRIGDAVYAQPMVLAAACVALAPHRQVILAGAPEAAATTSFRAVVAERFAPDLVVISADGGDGQKLLTAKFEVLKDIAPVKGKPAAFLCVDRTCDLPVTEPAALAKLLDR